MTEIDPYSVLGVPRTATREVIARSYRSLAKRYHPDAGAEPSLTMSRINEAWFILSDASRRATWDRAHAPAIAPHWIPATAPAEPMRRPPARPQAPPSRLDSGWAAAGVVTAVAVVLGVTMLVIWTAVGPVDDRLTFSGATITLEYPDDWTLGEGRPAADGERSVLAHFTTFGIGADELCMDFGAPCEWTGDAIPAGEASIVITDWRSGSPPVPDPVTERPAGLDADAIIGGQPAAFASQRSGQWLIAWWQLSPPGFPDRWIEVRAEIARSRVEEDERLSEIWRMVESIQFTD